MEGVEGLTWRDGEYYNPTLDYRGGLAQDSNHVLGNSTRTTRIQSFACNNHERGDDESHDTNGARIARERHLIDLLSK